MKRSIVFIPGLGDRRIIYRLLCWLLWRPGWQLRPYIFGWEESDGKDFEQRYDDFLTFLEDLPSEEEVFIVGVSAGGTVAVQAFADVARVRRVVTIASPLGGNQHIGNKLLRVAHARLKSIAVGSEQCKNIFSIYGAHDQLVPKATSQFPGAAWLEVPPKRHGQVIVYTLLLCSGAVRRFLKTEMPSRKQKDTSVLSDGEG